jgi:RNA polymerase sigma-70 factor (ECF subfamily)
MAATPTTGGPDTSDRAPDLVFEEHRPLLTGLAYRLLGSMWDAEDAEDAVQETYPRWTRADRGASTWCSTRTS